MRTILAATSLIALACGSAAQAQQSEYAPVATLDTLVEAVDIPYEEFTLDNGLTVIVHEDRKAPVVAVSVWYDVGSKHEPAGKTGFAHLFEHLMFNGSENAPGEFFQPLRDIGATDTNGTTNADRTNYFETVPTGALETALFLESDRMGHLLGAVTQEKLDNQRGVVQNEKRQGDNAPYGLLRYEVFENLFPKGHRYHHSTIGSMGDLNAASMEDVQTWFKDHYGPNNAVLVLAGDIDAATARPLVEKYFGDIARGPEVQHPNITVPTLAANSEKVITDQIATTRIYRMWPIPGEGSAQNVPLSLGLSVLGGLASSRLDNALVREDPVAVSVAAFNWALQDAGVAIIQADVKPGVDPAEVAAKLDAEIAKFLVEGPTADELLRSKTQNMAGVIRGLESVGGFGGKAPVLAGGELFEDDPAYYKKQLQQMADATPAQVAALTREWLSKPRFSLIMNPGERTEGGENRGGAVTGNAGPTRIEDIARFNYCQPAECDAKALGLFQQAVDRSKFPAVGTLTALDFPAIERAKLSNGMEVFFARRDAVPTVDVRVSFNAGAAADPRNALGTQSLMLQLMDEGTKDLDATELAIARERLGASISAFSDFDSTSVQLSALEPNLAPSLNLLADYVRNPAFDATALERVRAQQLNRLNSELKNPNAIASRILAPTIYGEHPYGVPPSGLGDAAVVQRLTASDLAAFHAKWFRPDLAKVFVVGNTTLAEVTRGLEAAFGNWRAPASPAPTKNFSVAVPKPQNRIILVNRPNSPQSVIGAARVLDVKGTDDTVPLMAANEVLGGDFLSRINMNLREDKGWSYGSRSSIATGVDRAALFVTAPVQADRTGDSIRELRKDLTDFTSSRGVSEEELARTVNGNIRELPGQFETAGDVMNGMVNIVKYGRPDTYYEDLAARYQGFKASDLDAAARAQFIEPELVFVVVGDASVVRPQLEGLGLPIEERAMTGN